MESWEVPMITVNWNSEGMKSYKEALEEFSKEYTLACNSSNNKEIIIDENGNVFGGYNG